MNHLTSREDNKGSNTQNAINESTNIIQKGVSGSTHNQQFHFEMSIDNPAMTAQMMISAARAVVNRSSGAYTILQLPVIDMLYGSYEEIIRRLL